MEALPFLQAKRHFFLSPLLRRTVGSQKGRVWHPIGCFQPSNFFSIQNKSVVVTVIKNHEKSKEYNTNCKHTKDFSLYVMEWDPTKAASASQAELTTVLHALYEGIFWYGTGEQLCSSIHMFSDKGGLQARSLPGDHCWIGEYWFHRLYVS